MHELKWDLDENYDVEHDDDFDDDEQVIKIS
jgi:hypothetical protein